MSKYRIGSIHGRNIQIGDHNKMVVHQSVTRLEEEVDRHRDLLDDPESVEGAVRDLSAELSSEAPRPDRLAELIGTIDVKVAGAPTVVQSLDEVCQMLGIA